MKMNEVKSRTWRKMAEIPTDDFSITGITRAINKELAPEDFTDILAVADAIYDNYIQICDDGIIVWWA